MQEYEGEDKVLKLVYTNKHWAENSKNKTYNFKWNLLLSSIGPKQQFYKIVLEKLKQGTQS
jgi:hypothetical protein